MYVAVTKPLFAWDCLQDSPSLGTIRQFLRSIPDAKLLEGLRLHRGRGRNDCPVYVAWGVVLLRIALRHVSVEASLPDDRIETLAYDKAADDSESHRVLRKAGIRPVIQNRRLWKDQTEQMLPGHDGTSNIVYDEAGTVYCYDCTSLPIVRQKMAYIGCEPQRETIKYRCPARHEGWPCPHDAVCNAGKSYGKTVRVNRTIDLRRFTVSCICAAVIRR